MIRVYTASYLRGELQIVDVSMVRAYAVGCVLWYIELWRYLR